MIIKIFPKTDILSLQGIRLGPLSESNCSSVLLNLLNELRKRDKMRGLQSIYLFSKEFNKFNNTRAHMLDSIYRMTLKLL